MGKSILFIVCMKSKKEVTTCYKYVRFCRNREKQKRNLLYTVLLRNQVANTTVSILFAAFYRQSPYKHHKNIEKSKARSLKP